MAKRPTKSQEPEVGSFEASEADSGVLEEALVGDSTEEPTEALESAEVDPGAEIETALAEPLAWILAQVDAGKGPVGIITNHSRNARAAVLALDQAAGDRPRTLSIDRARLGVAGVEVKGYSAVEQLRGLKLGAAWIQAGCSQRMLDATKRALLKGAELLH
jgi:hypothetical protein